MRLLMTGFEPFGQRKFNASWEAVKRARIPAGTEVRKVRLPVTWAGAPRMLLEQMADFEPDAVLLCGLAADSDRIRVERVGINLCGSHPDNDGLYPQGPDRPGECPILPGGEAAYFSTFSHTAILAALQQEHIPAALSYTAGTYICNLVLYTALRQTASEGKNRAVGFIHVPEATETSFPPRPGALPLSQLSRALELTASVLASDR